MESDISGHHSFVKYMRSEKIVGMEEVEDKGVFIFSQRLNKGRKPCNLKLENGQNGFKVIIIKKKLFHFNVNIKILFEILVPNDPRKDSLKKGRGSPVWKQTDVFGGSVVIYTTRPTEPVLRILTSIKAPLRTLYNS